MFDPFILVKLSLLINLLQNELKEWKLNKKTDLVNQGTIVLNDLKSKLSKFDIFYPIVINIILFYYISQAFFLSTNFTYIFIFTFFPSHTNYITIE